ncbi:MAG: glucose-inhibited division protein A [Hormoscilla sp. SP5CHS1]|nr:glucose-inhibited division protein A [Hormoscilla sp. SP12CHS1]MBC6455648.1 glucose-inhibited division protein A [Hormoscilla sp. SP5CHS1]
MERGKIVAIITGAISLLLAIAYLMLVQLLDFRGEMIPAPQSQSASRSTSSPSIEITSATPDINSLTC